MARIRTINIGANFHENNPLRGWTGRGDPYGSHSHPDYRLPWEREWWIYFIQGDDGGPIKIGRTTQLLVRVGDIQTGYPHGQLGFCGLLRGVRATEGEVQKRFSRLVMRGEWFRPEEELVEYILSLEGDFQ